ncbi:MAG TPA: hypothetical protein VJ227_02530, partial [Patescibacteria group bacterium]|nr:hypothetical protein [Patescibacteria group bacterium]
MEREGPPITFLDKRKFSSSTLWNDIELHHQKGIEINKQLSLIPKNNEINIRINTSGPILLVPIGDTHLFSRYTSSEAVQRTFDMLDRDNSFGFVTGDFIEGMHPHIGDHIGSVELQLKEQLIAAADKLRPYFYANKLFCTVDGFFGHEGWSQKLAGMSAVEAMSWIMPKPDLKDPLNAEKWKYLPVLGQGGLIRLHLVNGREYVIKLFHDPNSGGSDNVNRHGGLKKQFMDTDDDPSLDGVKIDMVIAGHQHHRAVVSKEVFYDRMHKKERSVTFVSIGTAKGTDVDNPDPFLRAQSKGPTLGPGPGIIINQLRGSGTNGSAEVTKENVIYGYENTDTLFGAKKIQHEVQDQLNVIERQKLTGELIGKITDRVKKPVAKFNYSSDRATSEKAGRAPLFGELKWEVEGLRDFPIMVYLLADARYGSTSHDNPVYKERYSEILKQITENPYEFGIVGRHFVD